GFSFVQDQPLEFSAEVKRPRRIAIICQDASRQHSWSEQRGGIAARGADDSVSSCEKDAVLPSPSSKKCTMNDVKGRGLKLTAGAWLRKAWLTEDVQIVKPHRPRNKLFRR